MLSAQGGMAKGQVRAHGEAVRLRQIDAQLRDLVQAMNVPGIAQTCSSSAGHRWPLLAAVQSPFVMFKANSRYALKLATLIHQDRYVPCRYLHYCWDIAGQFDDAGEFVFKLECGSRRFLRSRLGRDFLTLQSWVQEVFRSEDARIRVRPETVPARLASADGMPEVSR